MDFIPSFSELPAHKYALLGIGLVLVIGFLFKIGWNLLVKAVALGVFVLIALFLLLAIEW